MSDQILEHALSVAGHGTMTEKQMSTALAKKAGANVTFIDWRGCMATVRHVDGVGTLRAVRRHRPYGALGAMLGCMVERDGRETWHPLASFRLVGNNDRIEVWT